MNHRFGFCFISNFWFSKNLFLNFCNDQIKIFESDRIEFLNRISSYRGSFVIFIFESDRIEFLNRISSYRGSFVIFIFESDRIEFLNRISSYRGSFVINKNMFFLISL